MCQRLAHHSRSKDPTKAATNTPPPADPTRPLPPFPARTAAVVVDPGPVEMVVVAPVALALADDEVAVAEEEKTLM
jgi:hypothetical protein